MLHQLTIPAYRNGLRALSVQLDRALEWRAQEGIGELQFIVARLAPDMFPLASQVRFTCIQALQPATRLGAVGAPEFAEDAADFAGLQSQIAASLAWLDTIDPATLGDGNGQAVSFTLPNGMTFDMDAMDYVRDWAQPQFYFHLVSAYAILRHMGVPIGKADYVGYMMRYLRPGTAPAD